MTPAKQSDLRKNIETIESLGGQLDYYPQSIQDITFQNVDDVVEWSSPFGSHKPDVTVLGEVGTDYYYTGHHYHVIDEGKPVGTIIRICIILLSRTVIGVQSLAWCAVVVSHAYA